MSYIKLVRESQTGNWIIKKRHTAFLLLTLIATRAKRTDNHPDKSLEIGEAEVGDFKSYGVTRQIYRDDILFLETTHQITTRRTNKGTIAKLVSYDVFDINEEERTINRTKKEPTKNQQRTTNNNENNVKKKEKKNKRKERLTIEGLMVIALKNKVSLKEVKDIEDDVFDSIENGDKYKVVSVKATINTWLRRAIKNNRIETIDDIAFEIMKRDNDPKLQERIRITSLKMNQ